MTELKCTCGVCNVCKTRERMRKKRARESLPAHEEELVQLADNLSQDTRPAARESNKRFTLAPRVSDWADNVAIWVHGAGGSYGRDTLQGRIYVREHNIDEDIRGLERQLSSFSKKLRRGREYWYQWLNGSWKYIGPVNGKHDPRTPIEEKIEARKEHRQRTRELMESCVIKELSQDHLLIDIGKYREHVDKKLPDNIILVKEVVG